MPKIVDKQAMSQKIISAALQAFVKHGFHNTSMTKIATEAGIAKGTLYLYFSSKDQLIEKITLQHFSKLKETLVTQQGFETTEYLLNHIQKTLFISNSESKFIPVFFEVFGPSFSSDKFISKYSLFFDEISSFYSDIFENLKSKGLINKELDPKSFSRVFVSMLDGIILHKGLFQIDNKRYNQMVKELVKFLERSLKP